MIDMSRINCFQKPVLGFVKNIYSPVHQRIMKNEIPQTVCCYANTQVKFQVKTIGCTCVDEQEAGDCKNQGKQVIPLKRLMFPGMMVFMENPQESMHDIPVGKPGGELHEEEGNEEGNGIEKQIHN